MATLQNVTDHALEVPLLRRVVKAGEEVEVDDALIESPDLVWPAGVWLVNGADHEHDPCSPENLEKAVGTESDQQASDEAATAPSEHVGPVTLADADPPVPLNTDTDTTAQGE